MNASFGIDHPLIAVDDIERMRARMISLGFNMTPIGQHPWGTSTSLAMFEGCLIEIMSVYDEKLLDEFPAGDFRFGRHVHTHLRKREGIALTALHSLDAVADAKRAEEAGFSVSGHLEFGRDVTLPDGRTGRTKTTLALMPDARWPRLSFFLCQQHRPELIYVPEWLDHPNTVFGVSGVTIVAEDNHLKAVTGKFEDLYGTADAIEGGFVVKTANGSIRMLSTEAFATNFGALPGFVRTSDEPGIIAVDLKYRNANKLRHWLTKSGVEYKEIGETFTLMNAADMGNTFFRFCKR